MLTFWCEIWKRTRCGWWPFAVKSKEELDVDYDLLLFIHSVDWWGCAALWESEEEGLRAHGDQQGAPEHRAALRHGAQDLRELRQAVCQGLLQWHHLPPFHQKLHCECGRTWTLLTARGSGMLWLLLMLGFVNTQMCKFWLSSIGNFCRFWYIRRFV